MNKALLKGKFTKKESLFNNMERCMWFRTWI